MIEKPTKETIQTGTWIREVGLPWLGKRCLAKWDYTGWEKWLKVDEDVNDPKDIANAKSRMRKAAAKSAFKVKKGQKWLS